MFRVLYTVAVARTVFSAYSNVTPLPSNTTSISFNLPPISSNLPPISSNLPPISSNASSDAFLITRLLNMSSNAPHTSTAFSTFPSVSIIYPIGPPVTRRVPVIAHQQIPDGLPSRRRIPDELLETIVNILQNDTDTLEIPESSPPSSSSDPNLPPGLPYNAAMFEPAAVPQPHSRIHITTPSLPYFSPRPRDIRKKKKRRREKNQNRQSRSKEWAVPALPQPLPAMRKQMHELDYPTEFPEYPTGYIPPSPTRSSTYATGYKPLYPTGYKPPYPTGYKPPYPTGYKPPYPTGYKPPYPTGYKPPYPTGYKPPYPTGYKPPYPTGYKPPYPTGYKPPYPTGYKPPYPTGYKPPCPTGYKPPYPTGYIPPYHPESSTYATGYIPPYHPESSTYATGYVPYPTGMSTIAPELTPPYWLLFKSTTSVTPLDLDMFPMKGAAADKMRRKGRLCHRHVLMPEGPKYDSQGNMYMLAYNSSGSYKNTKRPKFILPRCCNCCRKSVLGCE